MKQTPERTTQDVTVPSGIDSPTGKLCYTYLSVSGPSTIGELTSALELRRLDLFPLLERLQEREWVLREGEQYTVVGTR
jgi:hypothetical protein